jgi:hypothetical protein
MLYVHFSLILSYYVHLITKYTAFAPHAGTELVVVEMMKKYSQTLLLITSCLCDTSYIAFDYLWYQLIPCLTTTLHFSVRSTLIYNDTKY